MGSWYNGFAKGKNQKLVIQYYFTDRPISALQPQHSNIPLHHHSMWPEEISNHKKNNNSSKLLQDVKVLIVNTLGDFFQEVFGLSQLAV